MKQLGRQKRVRLEISASFTVQENRKVERKLETKTLLARCLTEHSRLDNSYRPYAFNISNDKKNFCFN